MTIRDIGILFGFEFDESSERNVESKVNSLKSFAAKALGAIGLTLSISGISSAITSCVSLASEVEEMENKFDVVFGNIRNEVDKWAESYADAVGRNKNDIKTYLADQQNLLVGFGMTREAGAKLSEEMTSLALDLASFGNMDEAASVDAMTKAVMGESEAAKTLGAVLNDSTRAQAMHTLGLSGTYEKLDQLTKMQVNYQAILSQSPDAIGDCERSLGSYESTVRRFESKLREVKQLIGQFFMPTFQKFISVGAKGLTVIRDFAEWINKFAEEVGGTEQIIAVFTFAVSAMLLVMNAQKIYKMVDAIIKFAKANGAAFLSSLKLFAGFLLFALLIQDFIAFMRGDNSLIGTLLDKSGVGAENARKTIIKAWNKIKQFLTQAWTTIKNIGQSIFESLSKWWSENGDDVKNSFLRIWNSLKTILASLWKSISSLAKSIFSSLKKFWDQWGETIISVFSTIWNTLISLINPFLDALAAVTDFISNVMTGNIEGALGNITSFFNAAIGAISILLDGLLLIVESIFNGIVDFIFGKGSETGQAIKDCFSSGIEFLSSLKDSALQWGSDLIGSFISGISNKVSELTSSMSGVAGIVKSFIHFSEPDTGPLSDFHTYMPDMIATMVNGIRAGKDKVKNALGELTGDMSVMTNAKVMAKANIVSPKTVAGVNSSNISKRTITQNVNINNQFNGERSVQQKSSEAMDKASKDATGEMARALQIG